MPLSQVDSRTRVGGVSPRMVTFDLNWTGMGNEWILQRLEMGHNRSVSRLIRQVNDNPEIKRLCSKFLMMLPCEG